MATQVSALTLPLPVRVVSAPRPSGAAAPPPAEYRLQPWARSQAPAGGRRVLQEDRWALRQEGQARRRWSRRQPRVPMASPAAAAAAPRHRRARGLAVRRRRSRVRPRPRWSGRRRRTRGKGRVPRMSCCPGFRRAGIAEGRRARGPVGQVDVRAAAIFGLVDVDVQAQLCQVLGQREQGHGLQRGRHRIARLDRSRQHHAIAGRGYRGLGKIGLVGGQRGGFRGGAQK